MNESILCARSPLRPRKGFWPVGLKEVPDYCHSPAKDLQGLPVACSVKANILAWHLRPFLSEPSSCSSNIYTPFHPAGFIPGPSTRQVVPSPRLYPDYCPHLKALSPFLLPVQILVSLYRANPLSPEFLQHWLSNLSMHQTHGEGLLRHRSLGPPLASLIS